MGRVSVTNVDEAVVGAQPDLPGVVLQGDIVVRGVSSTSHGRLRLWTYEMRPGSSLRFDAAPVDHTLYVQSGALLIGSQRMQPECVAVVEHGAGAGFAPVDGTATLLHFHADPEQIPPTRSGGHVHVLGPNGKFHAKSPRYESSAVMWADSGCDSCQVWLHKSLFGKSVGGVGLHYHTEDEIIFIVGGEMKLGKRGLLPGTALAIDQNTRYRFDIGDAGLDFLNFRASEPWAVRIEADGREGPQHSEKQYWNEAPRVAA